MALDPGGYTVGELLQRAGVNHEEVASVDYNNRGWDANRLRIGGLRFDELDDVVAVPEGAETVEISVDGEVVASLDVNSQDVPEAAANFKAAKSDSKSSK